MLSWISQGTAVSFGLIMALAGETVGMLEDWRQSIIAVIGYLALLMFTNYLIGGWQIYFYLAGHGRCYDGVRPHLRLRCLCAR